MNDATITPGAENEHVKGVVGLGVAYRMNKGSRQGSAAVGPFPLAMRTLDRYLSQILAAAMVSTLVMGCGSSTHVRSPVVDVSPRQSTGGGLAGVGEDTSDGSGNTAESDGPGIVSRIFGGPDGDGDGILDDDDKCPSAPEDFDAFEDGDGCPENDNDGDGIVDWHDKCPNAPETMNGFQDEDGCPDASIDRAKRAFHEGATAFAQADYAKARKHFEEAHSLEPRDTILYNIAVCADKQGDRKTACLYYRQWRATPGGSTSANSIPALETCP